MDCISKAWALNEAFIICVNGQVNHDDPIYKLIRAAVDKLLQALKGVHRSYSKR
jgi:hypothetical protein